MSDDPLEELLGNRKPKPVARRAATRTYEAFNPVDKRQLRVRICPAGQPWEWLPYAYLQRIVTEGDHGTRIALIWAFAVVVIEGRNLHELDWALAHENIDAIRAFDPARFDPPADTNAAFIEKIEIHVRDAIETAEATTQGDRSH